MNILVIEDDTLLADYVRRALSKEGHHVTIVHDGREGVKKAHAHTYDAIILDIILPEIDGLTICGSLRQDKIATPILLLSSRTDDASKVAGLDAGADDYLTKPFSLAELSARIRAITRRPSVVLQSSLEVADLVLDPPGHRAIRGGQVIALRPKEYELLEYLMKNEGVALPRTVLLRDVWKVHSESTSNRLEVHIRQLRKKIDSPFDRQLIHTVRGFGYRLEAPLH